MSFKWTREAWRLAVVLALSATIGSRLGNVWGGSLFGVMLLLAWHARQFGKILSITNEPSETDVRLPKGLWSDLHVALSRLEARHRRRERRLTDQLREFKVSAAALPDAVISLGEKFEIRWMNDTAVSLLGLNPVKDLRQPLVNLYRSPELARYLDRRDFAQVLEISAAGRSTRKLLIRAIPYSERRLLILAQDVTERHRLEQVRTDFVANVSHELRTPLTVISGFVENLQHDNELSNMARLAKPLKLMAQQTTRMQRIVEELLLLARLEGTKATLELSCAVDVSGMCAELRDIALSSKPDVPCIRVEADASLRLLGDEQQLRSAFQNLVVNAINHTPADGTVDIRWYRHSSSQRVCFEVVDSGIGISQEHLPRLTERFYRVDTGRSRSQGGTGLGLAIVKHVLNHHSARLAIESTLGEGSRFRCEFPVSRVVDVKKSEPQIEKAS